MPDDTKGSNFGSQSRASVELLTRVITSSVIFVYAVGFVILAFHDAKYGVVQYSPFRARIVLVGFVFTALVSLAAAAQHYGLGHIPPARSVLEDSAPERRHHREVILAAGFVFVAAAISSSLGAFLFHQNARTETEPFRVWHFVGTAVLVAISYLVFLMAAKTYPKKSGLAMYLSLLGAGIYIPAFALNGFGPSTALTCVLALVGWLASMIKHKRQPLTLALNYGMWISALFITWLYINWVFSALPQRWGGGQPTPIQIFQTTPSTWAPSNPIDALLLDETDEGLYILLSPNGRAFYLPKSYVAGIFFGSKEDMANK